MAPRAAPEPPRAAARGAAAILAGRAPFPRGSPPAPAPSHPHPLTPPPTQPRAEERLWGELCARGFSHRPGDPTRFYRKLRADPQCPREGVRVVVAPSGAFVGSVRVLRRDIDVDGAPAPAAGIAEVCTDPEYRGQGVAGVALPDAMAYVDGHSGGAFSLLHAAAAVAPLYARYGYAPMRVPYSRLPLGAAAGGGAALPAGAAVRAADLADAGEVAALDALRASLNAHLGATGFTHRSPAYWQRWLATAAGPGYRVLTLPPAAGAAGEGAAPRVAAYACVMHKDGIKLWDCGYDPAALPAAEALAFVAAVAAGVVAAGTAAGRLAADAPEAASLLLPTRLAGALCPPGSAPEDPAAVDAGWMARPIPAQAAGDSASAGLVAALAKASDAGRYLVWAADAF